MSDDDDPFGSCGLSKITLDSKPEFDLHFSHCTTRLSDYSFANTFIWRDSIHLHWRIIHDCLCVFANGDGGLTMLFPPVGKGDFAGALKESMAICGDYNIKARYDMATRIEYVSQEMLEKFPGGFTPEPMSGDYVYLTQKMIDLDGGELASKRQARNRFARRYEAKTEHLAPHHVPQCLELLESWEQQSKVSEERGLSTCVKRQKEVLATQDALMQAQALGLEGMVLYADGQLIGFTLGEILDSGAAGKTCSIVIEKTDRNFVGSAQYIFSEFCRQYWPATKWCNVGDDWEVPSLAWTKASYRPAFRIPKWVLRPVGAPSMVVPRCTIPQAHQRETFARSVPADSCVAPYGQAANVAATAPVESLQQNVGQGPTYGTCQDAAPEAADLANIADLDALLDLERRCQDSRPGLSRRSLRHLLLSPNAKTFVIRKDGKVLADALATKRKTRVGTMARLHNVTVDSSRRGMGYGQMLLASCIDVLRKEGVVSMFLEADVKNAAAIGLYDSMGFAKVRLLADHYAPGQDAWKMRLDFVRHSTKQAGNVVESMPLFEMAK